MSEKDDREVHSNHRRAKEVEATLNNHPLTYLYDDTEGVSQALIPADLIYGHRLANTPSGSHFEAMSTAKTLTKRAKHQF